MHKGYIAKVASAFLIIIFSLNLCTEKKPSPEPVKSLAPESEYQYADFMPGKEPIWGSLQEIQKSDAHQLIEVSRFVGQPQTPEQKKAADKLYSDLLENINAKGWYNIDKALEDGYVIEGLHNTHERKNAHELDYTLGHFPNYEFVFDNEDLNPNKPEYLMFYKTDQGMILVGVMFVLADLRQHGEQIGGQETVWHYHNYGNGFCENFQLPQEHKLNQQYEKRDCEKGFYVIKSTEMLHVWFIDHPKGRFSSEMTIGEDLVFTGINHSVL